MLESNIYVSFATLIWAMLVWIGVDGMISISERHIDGEPNADQLNFFVWYPAGVFFGLLIALFVCNRFRKPLWLALIATISFALFPSQLYEFGVWRPSGVDELVEAADKASQALWCINPKRIGLGRIEQSFSAVARCDQLP